MTHESCFIRRWTRFWVEERGEFTEEHFLKKNYRIQDVYHNNSNNLEATFVKLSEKNPIFYYGIYWCLATIRRELLFCHCDGNWQLKKIENILRDENEYIERKKENEKRRRGKTGQCQFVKLIVFSGKFVSLFLWSYGHKIEKILSLLKLLSIKSVINKHFN